MYRSFSRLSLICAGLVLSSLVVSAQTKVVIIDGQKSLMDTAEIKATLAQWDKEFKPKQDEIAKLQSEIQNIQNQLVTMAGKLNPQAENDMRLDLAEKQKQYQRKGEDYQAELEARQTAAFGPAGQRMKEVLDKLAAEKGYDVILDVSNTVYYKPALDITAEATAAYNAAHPAGGAAAAKPPAGGASK